ncbi:MAG: BON domain-containing protein [Parvibaculum sp.]
MRFGTSKMQALPLMRAALITLVCAATAGCSIPGMVIGAGATAGIAAAEERGVETAFDDLKIDLVIKQRLLELDEALVTTVSTEVFEGRVLLTGTVGSEDRRLSVTRLAWSVEGVAEVMNELRTDGESSIAHASRDTLITTELRARMMGDGDVSAINYNIETVRGTIYLLGIARSQAELTRVVHHARNVSGVRKIVPLVRIKAPDGVELARKAPESAI